MKPAVKPKKRSATPTDERRGSGTNRPATPDLYRLAEARLRELRKESKSQPGEAQADAKPSTDAHRLLQEIQVHQIELEMQNTELRQSRDKLEQAVENYTDLYDFAPVGYFTLTADSTIQQANLTGASIVGIDRSRLVGRRFDRHLPAALRPVFQAFLKKILAGSAKESGDFELLCHGQPSRLVNMEARRPPNGESCRIVVVDITARKRAEEDLRVSEVRYEDLPLESKGGRHQEVEVVANLYQENGHSVTQCNVRDITARKLIEKDLAEKARLLDLSHDAIIVRDMKGHVLYWNRGAEELYGWARAEALGKISHVLLKTKYPLPLKLMVEELHRTDRWIGELVHTSRAGRRITVLARKTLDRDSQGRPAAVLQNITDITERKIGEETLRRVALLDASNRKLEAEIVRRQGVEKSLQESERHQRRLLVQSQDMQVQLRHLSHQILSAQEEERKKISRALHDEITQTLAGINLQLGTLKEGAGAHGPGFQTKIKRTQRLVEKAVDIVHRFARDLRPSMLDDLGLIPALHAFVKTFSQETGLRVRLTAFDGVEQLDNTTRTVLYRVAQEALTNVDRHARASAVDVRIQKLAARVTMTIRDNGACSSPDHMAAARRRKRLGLIGMRERLEMVGGKFEVQCAKGQGTTVRAEVPCDAITAAKTSGRRSGSKR